MCVVVVVEIDSDVTVCALSSTPALLPALPSNWKEEREKKGMFLFSQKEKNWFSYETPSSVQSELKSQYKPFKFTKSYNAVVSVPSCKKFRSKVTGSFQEQEGILTKFP